MASRVEWESEELERIDRNVVKSLGKLSSGKSLKDGEDSGSKVVEHWFALLHWLHLDLDLKEVRQGIMRKHCVLMVIAASFDGYD